MCFQQDGATCHIARVTMDLLRGELGKHFSSSSGPINCSPLPCDLTPLDYFLWGYIKAHVNTDKPAAFDALEDNIEAFIHEIAVEMLERICHKRMDHLKNSRGQHLHEIIFKH